MKLATPNFKNKTASIIWMLCLAVALIFVDYFYGEIQVNPTWAIKKHPFTSLEKLLSSATDEAQQHCSNKTFQFRINSKKELIEERLRQSVANNSSANGPSKIIAKPPVSSIICTTNEIYFLQNKDYTGSLSQYILSHPNNDKRNPAPNKIVSKLHSPENFFLINKSIYIVEQGLERVIQLTPHSIGKD